MHDRFDAALAAQKAGNLAEAMQICRDILKADARNFKALYLLGYVHAQSGEIAEAERLIAQAIGVNPRSPDALYNRGCLLQKLDRLQDAIVCFDSAIALNPYYIDALINRGVTLAALKRYGEAASALDRALRIRPGDAAVWIERGNALTGARRYSEALSSYDKALEVRPNYVEAWENRGRALMLLERHSEALTDFDKVLAADPRSVAAWTGRGNALGELRRDGEALAAFGRALRGRPDSVGALLGRGYVLLRLMRYEEAIADYNRALAIAPDSVQALINRAAGLFELKRLDEAIRDYERALALNPDIPFARGNLAYYKLHACDWRHLEEERNAISEGLRAGKSIVSPFVSVALSPSAEEQSRSAHVWIADKYPPAPPLWRGEIYRHDRMRIAYLSADFNAHATAHLMSGVFEHHDRQRFETIAISYGPDDESGMRTRLQTAFDRFIDVRTKSDFEIAALLRQLEVNIAIDLKGLTKDARSGILSHRPAPIQTHYLGYPGTMGAPFMDYIIADGIVIPEDQRRFYTEQVVYLPDTYQCNDGARDDTGPAKARAEYGLPETGFVFCCFNNNFKILPDLFKIWMRLLARVDGAVLWLMADNANAARNLAQAASEHGIAPDRLIFAPRIGVADHLARHRAADLFLDTLPYGAHTTASDALWAGLPVITCLGSTFAGRVGASLLSAIGLPELVARSLEEYEALVLKLVRDPAALAAIKEKLARNRDTHALFDTSRFTRNLEAALITMWERHRRGEPRQGFTAASSRE